ncbi:hypothetical protein LOTGIDRAFT_137912, partial [Lottia gigantea]
KKRPKSYYKKCANIKRKRLNQLESGMRGYIVTCDREKEATREAYNLLNDFADQLYGAEKEDLEAAMKKEVDAMKETKPVQRRFQRLDSRTKNCLFIKTDLENPAEVTNKIFENLLETKTQRTRFAMKLMPVDVTCKAVNEEILKTGKDLFEKHFSTPFGEGRSYSIVFKARNNNSIKRDDLIPPLSHYVGELNPAHTVEHNNPDFVISVQILCTVCCISILKNFNKFRKYNLHEVVKTVENSVDKTVGDAVNKPDGADVKQIDATSVKQTEGDEVNKTDDTKQTDGAELKQCDATSETDSVVAQSGCGDVVKDTSDASVKKI